MSSEPVSCEEMSVLACLEAKVNALLPPQYRFASGPANPRSMGSAGLKFGADSRVAWDEIWTTFCDLALAGGPPHRGSLLEAPTAEEVRADPAGYQLVSEEIARGVRMAAGLPAAPAEEPGWVEVRCPDEDMASWLLRAVMAENVFVRLQGDALLAPAGPWFRLAREVKNVVVALTKPCHYWTSHMSAEQRQSAGVAMRASAAALLAPVSRPDAVPRAGDWRAAAEQIARAVAECTDLPAFAGAPLGWVGVRLADESTAAWFVRAAIAESVLARREEHVLFLPVPDPQANSFEAIATLRRLARLWQDLPPAPDSP